MNKLSYIPATIALLAVVFFGQSNGEFFGVKAAFGYGGGGHDETITLSEAGEWAIVSPSKRLALFDYAGSDIDAILTYNAASGLFVIPAASELLEPLNAFYLKPNVATEIYFDYGFNDYGFASKNLSTGWNLIGVNSNGSPVDEFATLSSATVLHNPGTGNTRKSPAGGSWGSDANCDISKVNWPNNKYLDSHDGYWIYLTAAETFSKLLN